jgi:hypothetical protein
MPDYRIVANPSPFAHRHYKGTAPEGVSIAGAAVRAGVSPRLLPFARAWIDGVEVPAELLPRTYPKAGHTLSLSVVPRQGAQGQYNGIPPDTLRMALTLLFAVAGGVAGGAVGGIAGSVLTTGISLAGIVAVNALVPPPLTDLEAARREGITGSQNKMAPFAAVPRIYGRMRVFPPHASRPFTVIEGNDQYLHMLFCLGYGELEIDTTTLRIGNTPIANFEGVRYVVYPGRARPTIDPSRLTDPIFPHNVQEEQISKKLEYAEDWDSDKVQQHTTLSGVDAEELSVDITFPSGLYSQGQGIIDGYRVDIAIQYRVKGTTEWTPIQFGVVSSEDEIPETQSQWYTRLETLAENLEDILTVMEGVDGGDRILDAWLHARLVARLAAVNERLEDAVATTPEQQAQLDALGDTVQELLGVLATAILDSPVVSTSAPWLQGISNLTQNNPALESWMQINRYIHEGYAAPEVLREMPAWRAWRIHQQGLWAIFAKPEPGATVIYDNSQAVVRHAFSWPVGYPGEYEVRIRRTSEGPDEDAETAVADECFWTALRATEFDFPIKQPGVAALAVRIKASEQLNNVVDTLSVVCTAKLPQWTGSAWTAPLATRNPAWALCDVLRGAANPYPVADSRLDLAALKAWADACAAEDIGLDGATGLYAGRCFDAAVDRETTVRRLLDDIARVGRASFGILDDRYTVIRDVPQTVPVQKFTPANSWGFRASRSFPDLPHGLKIRFIDETSDWQDNETTVYADGYSAAGGTPDIFTGETTVRATSFESVDLWGVTQPDQVFRDGRYNHAVARLRPEVYRLECDFEHLRCTRGDLVLVQHDVPMWGLHHGRIVRVDTNGPGGDILQLVLDTRLGWAAGETYGLKVRTAAGAIVEARGIVRVTDIETDTFIFPTPMDPEEFPVAAGDLFTFGRIGLETVELIVKEIRPREDMTAELVLIDHAPAVHDADTGPIPPWTGQITIPPEIEVRVPPPPQVERIVTDESALARLVDGTVVTQIVLYLKPWATRNGNQSYARAAAVDAQYRASLANAPEGTANTSAWVRLPAFPADALVVTIPNVKDGQTYDVRLRSVTREGIASDWVTVAGIYVIGKATPPAGVEFVLREGDWLVWEYPDPPLDLRGFLVREVRGVSPVWDAASPSHGGVITETRFSIAGVYGQRTYLVKAVDTAGNVSTETAVVYVDLGDPAIENVIATYDHKALNWPGDETNCAADGDNNLAAANLDLFWGPDSALFWGADADPFWGDVPSEMAYTFGFTPNSTEVGCRLLWSTTVQGGNYRLEYRRNASANFWPLDMDGSLWPADLDDPLWPDFSGWLPWPGSLHLADEDYEFRIWVSGGNPSGLISECVLTIDVPDVEEFQNDVEIDNAAGKRLTLAKAFRAITNIQITLQYDSVNHPDAHTALYEDKQATPGAAGGPLIRVQKTDGTGTTGIVDVRLRGY